MAENCLSPVADGSICAIKFSIATEDEIKKYSISDCNISHASQLANPYLGLPLESGRCESCGTAEIGQCEGHFGYIELTVPVYHPSHVSELRDILTLVCLKCLRMKKVSPNLGKKRSISCQFCRDLPPIYIKEVKRKDGSVCLELGVTLKRMLHSGFWDFLDRYGFHFGDSHSRPLLPFEALNILKGIPSETKRRLAAKGYFPQNGFIMQHLSVPPNCLCIPEISDGKSIMTTDTTNSLLKKVLNKIEIIKRSRSGAPNFESHEFEAIDLQSSILQYMNLRGTTKVPQDVLTRYSTTNETTGTSTKQWLEKIRNLFIRKGSGFSSRSVLTGDAYIGVNELGIPLEIAKKITFEERVTDHNIRRLQQMVDSGLCITYKDGSSTYAITVGSKGYTSLKVGQVISRRIIDGDVVFINRPPSTHKHSLQAFNVFVHDDFTVKINPLVCAPLGADFDGDCVHIFYPQSLAAKAEVIELFSVEKQLLSSHAGNLNFQFAQDSLLALKLIPSIGFLGKATAQQLLMLGSQVQIPPALVKAKKSDHMWTSLQILQSALPTNFHSYGEMHIIRNSNFIKLDLERDHMQASLTDIVTSIYNAKGPKEAIQFFNVVQPLLMEILLMEGFSISLKDFDVPKAVVDGIQKSIQDYSSVLHQLRLTYNELVELQVENHLKIIKKPVAQFIKTMSFLGQLIDSRSESAINKIVQQIGFLGLQLFDRGKYYSKALVEDCFSNFVNKYSFAGANHPCEAYGLVKSSFFEGLNPYEKLVHSISSREAIVRSSRGLTEPGTLFKNLMAILRDVVICYDGSVRNVCSGSIIQFLYSEDDLADSLSISSAGEPVGVLAATAISNPAYKAVLDSSQSNNSSWELMKEILLCKVGPTKDGSDRRVILYLNDCCCGKRFCKENAAFAVLNSLKKITLKDCATDIYLEYKKQIGLDTASGIVGHIHLDQVYIKSLNQTLDRILLKCQDVMAGYTKKKGQLSHFFKRIVLTMSECCNFEMPNDGDVSYFSCLQFSYSDEGGAQTFESLEKVINFMANVVCPILLDTIIKGDPRVYEAKIIWIGPDSTTWVRNANKAILKGETALEVVIEENAARSQKKKKEENAAWLNGDAWRTVIDACLPVIHLVDTKRSIPCGVQQLRELFGISCAFDQAVQRLSMSIRMVAKGVLKEHLLLVANSMTCTGNLIGFNTGGFKSLFRSLDVQVPFTEATLFTPMKCFERAAEKGHSDSLSTVVSSCSWGKQVALGTGSPFQILWDKQQVSPEKKLNGNVYEFLEMVRTTGADLANGACLSDVDDLEDEFKVNGYCPSPEPAGNMTFDDDANEIEDIFQENGKLGNPSWEKASSSGAKSSWDGWAQGPVAREVEPETEVGGGWSGWGREKENHTETENRKDGSNAEKDPWTSNPSADSQNDPSSTKMSRDSWSFTAKVDSNNDPCNSGNDDQWSLKDKDDSQNDPCNAGGDDHWSSKAKAVSQNDPWSSTKISRTSQSNAPMPENENRLNENNVDNDSWSLKTKADSKNDPWTKIPRDSQNNACMFENENRTDGSYADNEPWSLKAKVSSQNDPCNAGNDEPWSLKAKTDSQNDPYTATNDDSWSLKGKAASQNDPWSSTKISTASQNNASVFENENTTDGGNADNGQWSSKTKSDSQNDPWSAAKISEDPQNSTWTNDTRGNIENNPWSRNITKNEGKKQSTWGDGDKAWKSGGLPSSNDPDKRNQKRYPPRPQGTRDEHNNWNQNRDTNAYFRQREPLSEEEQKIYAIFEPVMQRIKQILRESSDGTPISSDDQNFVLENVLYYHPDRQRKMVGEVECIKVDKHKEYQDTRCFYVVFTNGTDSDFSYLKCMKNFVKEKFPDNVESFCGKYFQRRRPAGTPVEKTGTPDGRNLGSDTENETAGTSNDNAGPSNEKAGTSNENSDAPLGEWG